MNRTKGRFFINMVESLTVTGMIVIITVLLLSCIKDIPSERLQYNPLMPVLSRIILKENGFNYSSIIKFILIGVLVFKTPVIGYWITEDAYKSASLCIMPAISWIVVAAFSYKAAPINKEIPFFLTAAFIHTVLSIIMYLRYLNQNVWDIDDEDIDFDDYYD